MSGSRLRGAVLVGGRSRRMGRPKSAILFGEMSLAARAAAALGEVCEACVFVGRGELAADAPALPALEDVPGIAGPLGGLLAALRHDPAAAWIIAACDLPLISSEGVRWLESERREDWIAVLPRLRPERVEPLLALYEPAARPFLERLAESEVRSLQGLADLPGVHCPEPPAALAPAWTNVNTESELSALAAPQSTKTRLL